MNLYEYQSKQTSAQFGIAIPEEELANTPDEMAAIAEKWMGRSS